MKIRAPTFSVSSLAERIRKGVARASEVRRAYSSGSGVNPSRSANVSAQMPVFESPRLSLQPSFTARKDDSYHVNDLLQYHDRNFVQNAYLALLKRGPDATGYTSFIEGLRGGRLNKIDVLARLRYSAEGRAKRVKVKGLFVPAAIRQSYRIPVVGYLLNLLVAIARLPSTIRSQQQFESHALAQQQLIADHLNDTHDRVVQHLASFGNDLQALDSSRVELIERLDALSGQIRTRTEEVLELSRSRFEELSSLLETHSRDALREMRDASREMDEWVRGTRQEIQESSRALNSEIENLNRRIERAFKEERQVRAELVLQEARVRRLLDQATANPPGIQDTHRGEAFSEERKHILDGFYLSLEDRFRGTRQEIMDRSRVYLPGIFSAGLGSSEMPILDVACGRGEWLELLKSEGLEARGVDRNQALVEQCRSLGLDVVEGEALEYLRGLPDQSVGAITGFHVVEHLPLDSFIQLLDETVRLVKPGGVVIFETPNPENVLVGSCNFYLDPTHRNPLPSQVLRFFVESRGFDNVEVMKLNPSEAEPVMGNTDLIKRFNEYFYGPMDYAVVGWKP